MTNVGASTLQHQVSWLNIMADQEQPLTQPSQELGVPQQQQEWATRRALELQTDKIVQEASAIKAELVGQGQFEPNLLRSRVIQLLHSAEDLLLDFGACDNQHAPNIRRGAPVQRNPSAAHTNLTADTDNGGALPLQDQALGAPGLNGDFIGIHQGNERPGQFISRGGAMTHLPATTNMPPMANPSVRRTPAPEDLAKPPTVHPTVGRTPTPKSNMPSKPSQPPPPPPPPPRHAVYSNLRHNSTPREGEEAGAQAHDEQRDTEPQSWPPTTRARAASSTRQLLFMPPGTILPSSGPRAMIHLEGEHLPRLQAEEPD